ncbi:MAG: GntR family transcriptional regulator, transcriptional repressor for pyruvate dehydrogenase complex [Acidimicrobiaceae bacterium]
MSNDGRRNEILERSTKLARGKISESLARDILRGVAAKRLKPGDRLPSEAEMLAEYGVGRSSLREGLRILEVLGLIEIRTGPGGGPTVQQVTVRDFARTASFYFQANGDTMREVVEARLELEPVLAANAARQRDSALVQRLTDANSRASLAVDLGDNEWAAASVEFHRLIVGYSGNGVLDLIAGTLTEIYMTRLKSAVMPMNQRHETHAIHVAITDAIRLGQAKKAETLMRSHMTEYANRVAKRYPNVSESIIDWQ